MHAFQSNRGLYIVFGNFQVIVSVVATTASGVLVSASLAVLTLLWMMYAPYPTGTVLTDMLRQTKSRGRHTAAGKIKLCLCLHTGVKTLAQTLAIRWSALRCPEQAIFDSCQQNSSNASWPHMLCLVRPM